MNAVDGAKPATTWLRRKWRAYCMVRRAAAEQNPGGILRLAKEVRSLAEAARRVCPPEYRLQSRITAVYEEMARLTSLAETHGFRSLAPEKRQLLCRGLVQSREQLLRVMGQAPSPSKFLQ